MATFPPPSLAGIGSPGPLVPIPTPRPDPATTAAVTPPPPLIGKSPTATLQALMARQKMAAERQGGIMSQGAANIPQGLSQLAWTFVNAMQERRASEQEAQGRQQLASVLSGIDPTAGPTSEQIGQVMGFDPDLAVELYKTRAAQQAKTENWTQIPTPAGETGQWYRNAVTGETKKVGGGTEGAGLKPTDVAAMYDDYSNVPDVKNYQNGQSMWLSMQDAAGRDTAQADLNMVIAMAKLFDPTSVVRTEEGKAVELTGDAPSSVKGYFQYLIGTPGSRLSKATRQGMMQEAYSRMNGYYKGVKQASDYFTQKAQRAGVNPADVVRPLDAPTEFDPEKVVGSDTQEQPDQKPPEEAPAIDPPVGADGKTIDPAKLVKGTVYKFDDGKARYDGLDKNGEAIWVMIP